MKNNANDLKEMKEKTQEQENQSATSKTNQTAQFDQIIIEFDSVRSQKKKIQKEPQLTENTILLQQESEKNTKEGERSEQHVRNSKEIELDYTFERFNAHDDYYEVAKKRYSKSEFIFEHKKDKSRITINKDKIICDNTDQNIRSALDIAQDKGWDVIKITGGSKTAKSEMWFQANMRGLETIGYQPTEADKKRLLGAQERIQKEEGKSIAEALDIKPKSPSEEAHAHQPISEVEQFNRTKKEIMAELEKVMPLNEKEYSHLENAVDEQLTILMKKGKPRDIQKFKEDLRNGLPTLRQELNIAAHAEQKQAQSAQKKQQSETLKNRQSKIRER
uniref:TraO n=1 Tax=Dichelobacter nodosus TaxID=870 RepID=Q5I733_DICNO|nr:TraO [Dichelobacter nodosus]